MLRSVSYRARMRLYLIVGLQCLMGSVSAATEKTDQMIRLLTDHAANARQFDGTYRAAAASRDAAWHAYRFAAAATGIKVTASATSFYTDRTEESTAGQTSTSAQRSFAANQVSLTAKKPLYRPRDIASTEQAYAQVQAAEALLLSADYTLLGRVFLVWAEVMTARDQLQIAKETLLRVSRKRIETEKRLKAGEATIDQLGLEIARQRQRQAEVFELQTRQELAEQALADLAGPNAFIPNSFTLDNAVPDRLTQITRGEIFQAIEERNPELIAARFSEQAALLEREKRNADHGATVDIYATASRGENDTAAYIKDEMRLGVQLSLPLYTSGALTSAVSQADADYQKMKAITQATSVSLKDRANSAFGAVKSTLLKIDAINALIQATELHAESIGRGVVAGVGSYGDLSRAEVEIFEARRQRSNELLKFSQAWAALSVLTSRIDSIFNRGPKSQPF